MAWRATYDTEAIDLLQLHCPPTEAFYLPEVFDGREALVQAGKLRHDGVSVEKVEEAIKAMDFPGGKRAEQVIDNVAAADLPELPAALMAALEQVYTSGVKPYVHCRW